MTCRVIARVSKFSPQERQSINACTTNLMSDRKNGQRLEPGIRLTLYGVLRMRVAMSSHQLITTVEPPSLSVSGR